MILGRGEGIEAYTDGGSFIAIVDEVAAEVMKQGLPGFLRLAHLLVHEYFHDSEDSGSHYLLFMEAFRDIVLDQGEVLFAAASCGFKRLVKGIGSGQSTRSEATGPAVIDDEVGRRNLSPM